MVKKLSAPSERARRRFLDAGLAVLGERGHAGLKLAQVCKAAGATTGSFYHAFGSWAEFKVDLIAYWRDERSRRLIREALAVEDPRARLDVLVGIGLALDRDSEAAIRVWSTHDREVLVHLTEVDRERTEVIRDTSLQVTGDADAAERFAQVAMYLLIGYQMGTIESLDALRFGFDAMLARALGE
ncbi:TetR/AcrR family transcriptional regulator [Gordonia neofelifaecis]|uniref:Putative transcriptional regulator, TetR family protein n=1 Tax=Gordonia neofelifaecis NRRL B-59395 TaxID=644548 RepID=F1YJ04_9ACTN|nr:TetR/AcrR family transcriptional regulator [Gordonia neofelifaecis]EGD55451.1 putative transcriptional regulator, TetR family protein [Gordonia neofelifaecis NRRL B-59395]